MDHLSSGESSKPHSPQKAFLIGELKEAKRTIAQKEEEMRQWRKDSKGYNWPMKDPTVEEDIIKDMNQEILKIMMAMKKKPNGGCTILKIGANMWQSLIYHL